ncbi:hypothetical protein NDU88_009350 [Pleurodeles waltl]|uniref:Uncharacterized protein n=1 Tax=Pleurodeles waltl TaxID=8319 RepID=A0AAV7PRV4_PLEWA|nr:hypothetical protein NDU88_009350 [Pleurodeles waltl]
MELKRARKVRNKVCLRRVDHIKAPSSSTHEDKGDEVEDTSGIGLQLADSTSAAMLLGSVLDLTIGQRSLDEEAIVNTIKQAPVSLGDPLFVIGVPGQDKAKDAHKECRQARSHKDEITQTLVLMDKPMLEIGLQLTAVALVGPGYQGGHQAGDFKEEVPQTLVPVKQDFLEPWSHPPVAKPPEEVRGGLPGQGGTASWSQVAGRDCYKAAVRHIGLQTAL